MHRNLHDLARWAKACKIPRTTPRNFYRISTAAGGWQLRVSSALNLVRMAVDQPQELADRHAALFPIASTVAVLNQPTVRLGPPVPRWWQAHLRLPRGEHLLPVVLTRIRQLHTAALVRHPFPPTRNPGTATQIATGNPACPPSTMAQR